MAGYTFDKYKRNRIAGRLAARYIRFVKKSSSVVSDPADPHALLRSNHPYILAMWHGQFMLLAPFAQPELPVANMVARHGDAEIIGEALKAFDMDLVRGGGAAGRRKDRGGLHAFREALRLLDQGTAIAMTADVPPGPARTVGDGIIKLAQMSGRPIIPVATASSRYRALDTWSRMTINLPFSRIGVTHGAPILVASDADSAAFEQARQAIETGLNEATERAYRLAGADAANVLPHAAMTVDDPPAPTNISLRLYRVATRALTPALPLVLGYRERQGKEEHSRRSERLGIASHLRGAGELVWLHAASVGETNAVLPLMDELRRQRPHVRFLLTTGTVTSAALARDRLPEGDIHQYAPLDAPAYMARFLDHWRPDLVALTESEIWPNTIIACHDRGIPIALVNARMSERSYKRWRKNRRTARPLFSRIRLILAQNERLARRFRELGGRNVTIAGNLKVDAPPLPIDDAALAQLRSQIGDRPVLLAASTHPGEDEQVIEAFQTLKANHPDLLLILAPRHPDRGQALADLSARADLTAVRRQANKPITPDLNVYVADTVGEMGLFYSLASVAFVGGSLIERGGQNPIEAIRFKTAVLTGPSQYNFADAYGELRRRDGVVEVLNAQDISLTTERLLTDDAARAQLLSNAANGLDAMVGALKVTAAGLNALLPAPEDTTEPDERLTRAS
ncbi:MAG: 3-deoxy-D-manno-octulosonic-acid transferase [Hyphomicrobiaceae bacterium]|jgi:3-deoxy-D-manno-octulosonic-acid transferase